MSAADEITIDRLDRALATTARAMVRHNLTGLLPTLKRLEAERDRLLVDGNAIEYAKRLLAA